MGTFWAWVILPIETVVSDDSAVEQEVAKIVENFIDDETSVELGLFFSCSCCKKEQEPEEVPDYAIKDSSLIISPSDTIVGDDISNCIMTYEPRFIISNSNWRQPEDPEWVSKAIDFCSQFHGHYSVLVRCAC